MENLKITSSIIKWERIKIRFGEQVKYQNEIMMHKDHISISKTMYIRGEMIRKDLVHVPLNLIDEIKKLSPMV